MKARRLERGWLAAGLVLAAASTGLRSLQFSGNELTGAIPGELGQLTSLTLLGLAPSELTGCIPAGLRQIEANDLGDLELPDCYSAGQYGW